MLLRVIDSDSGIAGYSRGANNRGDTSSAVLMEVCHTDSVIKVKGTETQEDTGEKKHYSIAGRCSACLDRM